MGALSRIRYVIAANVNALIEKAEDPEKLLRALIREMEDAGEDARMACAELLAEQQHVARISGQLESEISEWQERAEKAVATERDDLARAALKAKSELIETLESSRDEHRLLTERISNLEQDMTTLKGKLAEAKLKQKEMIQRQNSRPAAPHKETHRSSNERKMHRAMGRFDRLQSQVERLEARVRSYEVGGLAPSAWDAELRVSDPAIEAELEILKSKYAIQPDTGAVAEPVKTSAAAQTTAPSTEQA